MLFVRTRTTASCSLFLRHSRADGNLPIDSQTVLNLSLRACEESVIETYTVFQQNFRLSESGMTLC